MGSMQHMLSTKPYEFPFLSLLIDYLKRGVGLRPCPGRHNTFPLLHTLFST